MKSRMTRLRAVAGAGALVLAACTGGSTDGAEHAPNDAPGTIVNLCEPFADMPTGRIAYTRYAGDGSAGIYLMDPDGSNRTCLVDTPGEDTHPAWSSNGTVIAFTSDLDGDADVYTIRADGTGLRRLTNAAGDEFQPVWAQDGREIAYSIEGIHDVATSFSIHVIGPDGTGDRTVLDSSGEYEVTELQDWSPDGRIMVFRAEGPGGPGFFAMSPTGDRIRRMHPFVGDFGAGAVFSPDGERLVFQADLDGGCIYTMDADGTGLERITTGCADAFMITWSPDGQRIAFAGGPHGPADAYVMNADGTNRILIDDGADAAFLAWQPV